MHGPGKGPKVVVAADASRLQVKEAAMKAQLLGLPLRRETPAQTQEKRQAEAEARRAAVRARIHPLRMLAAPLSLEEGNPPQADWVLHSGGRPILPIMLEPVS